MMPWKTIKNYLTYLISSNGQIKDIKTKIILKQTLRNKNIKNPYLCVGLNNKGYKGKKGKVKTFDIHRLVGLTFIPNPNNYPEIDHINRNTLDNRVENLIWATRSMNSQNRGVMKNNKLKIKNISLHKGGKGLKPYRYTKTVNKISHTRYFKTLQEAIIYKNQYELIL